ncbi:MAG: hypothetical protein MUF87_18745 [Anaerolineae bacterium]|jgi:hypothetical protein|nr:hypothetical protein [Anaerolineae bacterium]
MAIIPLETDRLSCSYNETERILYVTYRGILSPDVTQSFYQWLHGVIRNNPLEVSRARGSIYDFRQVTSFDNRNLTAAQRQSEQLNMRVDVSSHPVALLIETKAQEHILQVELKISPQQGRKRIVRTEQEARDFIASFASPEEA